MKYPQLVSMPSAIQDWLDQQLEARGIDAVVYTRYIFSLLQKDSLDRPDEFLVLNKAKESGRRGHSGRKRIHREEYLSAWDCEQLKRSAVVQCLLSASDQKFGIEKLVDELCTKLKEIESESESSVHFALAESSKQVKQIHVPSYISLDETQKYYAAFPPLNSRFIDSATSNISASLQVNSVWNTGTKLSPTVASKKRVSSSSFLAEKVINRRDWKENKENVQENSWKEVGRENSKLKDHANEKYLPHKTEMGCRLAWDMDDNTNDGSLEGSSFGDGKMRCEPGIFGRSDEKERAVSPRRLYERQVESPQNSCEVQVQYKSGNHSVTKRMMEDKNLAQLIAKFDHSIEALWSPSESERLLSPCVLSADLEKKKDLSVHTSPNVSIGNPFIPSGTNITTSIWSENEDSIGNGNQSSEQILQTSLSSINCPVLANKNEENLNTVIWNKAESLPSVLTSLPFGLNYDFSGFAPNINQKWSDVESLNAVENYSQFGQIFNNNFNDFQETLHSSLTSAGLRGSLTALNHSKQDSSFTEVIPKTISDSNYTDTRMESINVNLTEDQPVNWEVEEEDLLTSARTHFRPIKQESVDSQKNTVTGYADGTTFLIPDGLETLPFQRSESGTLYLESDVPAKYMEYKEKELYGGRNRSEEEPSHIAAEFVPKFKIQQNEKCCQTEEKFVNANDEEIDSKRSRQDTDIVENEESFFFPGDEQLANKVDDEMPVLKSGCSNCRLAEVNYLAPLFQADFACLEHGGNTASAVAVECLSSNDQEMSQVWNEKLKICCDCKDIKLWKTDGSALANGQSGKIGNWEPDKSPKSWSDIWSSNIDAVNKPCQKCDVTPNLGHGSSRIGRNLQSLREELSQDGEQLLSDLSYMQHMFLGSDWSEESRELPVSKCLEDRDDGSRPSAEKFQCISPGTVDDQEIEMYADDTVYSRSLPGKQNVKEELIEHFETKSVGDFFSKCLRTRVLPSPKLEIEWRLNERPFNAKTTPKDRKRRHSASQRASSFASHDVASVVPRAQTACVKGVACPTFVMNAVEGLRPVTL